MMKLSFFHRFRSLPAIAALAALALILPAGATEPANFTYAPKPPGQMVDSQIVYLAGESMLSQWRAVTSRKLLGTNGGTPRYQWYLSIYAIEDTTYELFYQSPANGGPLSKVTQSVQIVGAARAIETTVEQLVVTSHETGAGCGSATVTVFAFKRGTVYPAVSLRNRCDLKATVVSGKDDDVDTIELTGPYYGPNAATCCPTKPKAAAVLAYKNGKWVQTPKYFNTVQ